MEQTNQTGGASDAAKQATTQAAGVASTAADQGSQVANTAAEGGKWVAAVGQDQAKQVATTAADQAAQVASEVSAQARNLLDESKTQLRGQAQTQTDQLASKLRELGDQAHALVEGRTDEAGPLADYARQAADGVSRLASRVDERGFDGVVDDVQRFARRRPGTFLLGAAVAGFGIGRLLSSGAMRQQSEGSGQDGPQGPTEVPTAPGTPYETLGFSTQPPPVVDVTDEGLGVAPLDATARIAPTTGTPADAAVMAPGSVPPPAGDGGLR